MCLALGIKVGATFHKVGLFDDIRYGEYIPDLDDPAFAENISNTYFNVGTGIFYYTNNYYLAFWVPNMLKSKHNAALVIMVKSHTDSRGSDQYNMSLSNRRAKSTVQYIISKGIAKGRISGQSYGESEPKVPCTDCTAEQHAQNRRSEFLIVKK